MLLIGAVAFALIWRRRAAGRNAPGHPADPRRTLASVAAALARGVRSGMTPGGSISAAAPRFDGEVGEHLRAVSARLERGVSLEDSLAQWVTDVASAPRAPFLSRAPRLDVADVELLVGAVTFCEPRGVGLAEAFEGVVAALLDRSELDDELRALTAQSSASVAVLCSLPVFGVFIGASVAPEVVDVLFGTALGLCCVTGALFLDTAAVFAARRLTVAVYR